MKRFAQHNRLAIEKAPLQTYSSALIFTPVMSIVRRQFADKMPRWMKRAPNVQNDWSALLQTLEGHSDFRFGLWPSRRTVSSWRRLRATGPSGSGTPPRERYYRRSRAIRVMSALWPSRRTVSSWRRLRATGPSGSGTPPRERYCRRSRLAPLSPHSRFLAKGHAWRPIGDGYGWVVHLLTSTLSLLRLPFLNQSRPARCS